MILGDNIFEDEINPFVDEFEKQEKGARIFLKEVDIENAKRFGIATICDNKVTDVEEKPKEPKSRFAMTGLYMFDRDIFGIIKNLKPSARGELEITDAINVYCKKGQLYYNMVKGFWSDAGTFESLLRASLLIKEKKERETMS